jgi:hypothetical protein
LVEQRDSAGDRFESGEVHCNPRHPCIVWKRGLRIELQLERSILGRCVGMRGLLTVWASEAALLVLILARTPRLRVCGRATQPRYLGQHTAR